MTDMDNPGHRGRATEFPNGIPSKGGPTEMRGGGMPGRSSDEDSNAGALPATACPRYRGHSGGGEPLIPTVRPMQHDSPLAGPERQAPCHIPLCQGSGAEEAAARGGGEEGELGAVLRGIRGTDTKCLDI